MGKKEHQSYCDTDMHTHTAENTNPLRTPTFHTATRPHGSQYADIHSIVHMPQTHVDNNSYVPGTLAGSSQQAAPRMACLHTSWQCFCSTTCASLAITCRKFRLQTVHITLKLFPCIALLSHHFNSFEMHVSSPHAQQCSLDPDGTACIHSTCVKVRTRSWWDCDFYNRCRHVVWDACSKVHGTHRALEQQRGRKEQCDLYTDRMPGVRYVVCTIHTCGTHGFKAWHSTTIALVCKRHSPSTTDVGCCCSYHLDLMAESMRDIDDVIAGVVISVAVTGAVVNVIDPSDATDPGSCRLCSDPVPVSDDAAELAHFVRSLTMRLVSSSSHLLCCSVGSSQQAQYQLSLCDQSPGKRIILC